MISYRDEPEDDGPDFEDATMEELDAWLFLAESVATDPDMPAHSRAKCDTAARLLSAEIEARKAAEVEP